MRRLLILAGLLLVSLPALADRKGQMRAQVPPVVTGAAPSWDGTNSTFSEFNSPGTSAITVSNALAAGKHAVLVAHWDGAGQTLSSVADSRGNTWTVKADTGLVSGGGNGQAAIISSTLGTGLQVGDTVTVTWGSPAFCNRKMELESLSNVTGVDVTMTNKNAFAQAVTAAKATTANTVIVGVVGVSGNFAATYSGGNWITHHTDTSSGNYPNYVLHSVETATGSKDPGGSWNTAMEWYAVWVAFK